MKKCLENCERKKIKEKAGAMIIDLLNGVFNRISIDF